MARIYAGIVNNTVKNVFVSEDSGTANVICRSTLGKDAIAIDVTEYPIGVGDGYYNGHFYRNNVEIGGE